MPLHREWAAWHSYGRGAACKDLLHHRKSWPLPKHPAGIRASADSHRSEVCILARPQAQPDSCSSPAADTEPEDKTKEDKADSNIQPGSNLGHSLVVNSLVSRSAVSSPEDTLAANNLVDTMEWFPENTANMPVASGSAAGKAADNSGGAPSARAPSFSWYFW